MALGSDTRRLLNVGAAIIACSVVFSGSLAVYEQLAEANTPPPPSDRAVEYLSSPPVKEPEREPFVMAIVGDSYALEKVDNWAQRTALCSNSILFLSAVGGSGFIDEGDSPPFSDPQRRSSVTKRTPDVVIFQTAYNDTAVARRDPDAVEDSVLATVAFYREVAPAAEYVILGPFAPGVTDTDGVQKNLGALQNAANAAGATHISGMSWLPTPDLIGNDGKHPNYNGHRRIAAHLVDSLKAEGIIDSTGGCGLVN